MRKPTDEEKFCFKRLLKTGEGIVLLKYFEEALHDQDVSNRVSPIEAIQKGQGKSILLVEIINHLTTQ